MARRRDSRRRAPRARVAAHGVDENKVVAGRGLTERAVCKQLRRLAAAVPADQAVVELGAYRGRTTAWLALGVAEGHQAPVYSVDPWSLLTQDEWPDYAVDHAGIEGGYTTAAYSQAHAEYIEHLENCGARRFVTPVEGFAADVGRAWHVGQVGLLFHDARHDVDGVVEDLAAWAAHIAPGGWVVLHDACQPLMGVVEGAQRALDTPDFDWAGRILRPWKKHPDRRGMLLVQRRPAGLEVEVLTEPGWVSSVTVSDEPPITLRVYPNGDIGVEHRCKIVGTSQLVCAPLLQTNGGGHTVTVTANGTTVAPSIACGDCGLHGYVRDDQWTNV